MTPARVTDGYARARLSHQPQLLAGAVPFCSGGFQGLPGPASGCARVPLAAPRTPASDSVSEAGSPGSAGAEEHVSEPPRRGVSSLLGKTGESPF